MKSVKYKINYKKYKDKMDKVLDKRYVNCVLYHNNCCDGFGSALVVNQYTTWPVEYIPINYGTKASDILHKIRNKNVMICDFSFKYNDMLEVINACNTVVVLDHHKTSEKELEKIPDRLKRFNMNKSGVGITWEYINGDNEEMPLLYELIQDRDLWLFNKEETKPLHSYLCSIKNDFEEWSKLLDENILKECIKRGEEMLANERAIIRELTSSIRIVNHKDGTKVAYCYAPILKSDIATYILEEIENIDFCAIYEYSPNKNLTYYSLRSTNDRADVSLIAERYKGGGHRNAAGFALDGYCSTLPVQVQSDSFRFSPSSNNIKLEEKQLKFLGSKLHKVNYTTKSGNTFSACYVNGKLFHLGLKEYIFSKEEDVELLIVWEHKTDLFLPTMKEVIDYRFVLRDNNRKGDLDFTKCYTNMRDTILLDS